MKSTPNTERQSGSEPDRGTNLWLWVTAGFLILSLAWTVMFIAARSAKVETVPLATKGARS
jgi:hypothetical protein